MHSDDDNKNGQFDASLQLPDEGGQEKSHRAKKEDVNPAADLIRKKVAAAYTNEPDAEDEIKEVDGLAPKVHRSKHQQFIYELTNSGRPLHEIQTAWHEYYAGLTDADKHQVWQEFYAVHAQTAHHPAVSHQSVKPEPIKHIVSHLATRPTKPTVKDRLNRTRSRAAHKLPSRRSAQNQALRSMLFGLGIGALVILIFLFSFFNERIIAPFIQPSRHTQNIPIIAGSGTISNKPEVIIPKINVEIPVVYDVKSIDEEAVQKGLERGVLHYADTALPGQDGNVVIFGHSSNNIFNPGNYKFAFVLLDRLQKGDTFYLQKDGKRYTYQVFEREIVKPSDVSVLGPAGKPATATLITCDPPGTSTNRLVVVGEQISPDPANNLAANASEGQLATTATTIPSNSPSLWARIVHWFTH